MPRVALLDATARHPNPDRARMHRDILMLDIIVLALGFAFFALAIGYTYACERL
jgi:hypothetical protein